MASSLATFDETNPKAAISSPRSLQACKQEGVLPQELIYKPVEAFQEKNLSPRLVKLRYDFFEAKRRDLLAAARRARDTIVADERRESEGNTSHQLEVLSRDSGLSPAAILAINSNGLQREVEKLKRAQKNQQHWLETALKNELDQLKLLEQNNKDLNEAAKKDQEKQQEKARLMKELNDRRQQDEERKALEAEARQKLEKQIAKEEFHKQQEELRRRGELEALKQKEAYERQLKEMDRKKQQELEKAEKKELAYREQEARRAEMRAQDLKRQDIMEQQKQAQQQALGERKEQRDERIYLRMKANLKLEQDRREELEVKQRKHQIREERLMHARALEQEESAKRSFQTMMRRKVIQEEAAKKQEERRLQILEEQEETEMRLLDHEQKKERYLDFKRELDGLRGKNKEINVERQRRREEASREMVAEQVRRKDEKIDALTKQRQQLWQLRRQAQSEAYRARELVKSEIMRQRVASKFDSKALEEMKRGLLDADLFAPQMLQQSASLPALKPSPSAQRGGSLGPAAVDPL